MRVKRRIFGDELTLLPTCSKNNHGSNTTTQRHLRARTHLLRFPIRLKLQPIRPTPRPYHPSQACHPPREMRHPRSRRPRLDRRSNHGHQRGAHDPPDAPETRAGESRVQRLSPHSGDGDAEHRRDGTDAEGVEGGGEPVGTGAGAGVLCADGQPGGACGVVFRRRRCVADAGHDAGLPGHT